MKEKKNDMEDVTKEDINSTDQKCDSDGINEKDDCKDKVLENETDENQISGEPKDEAEELIKSYEKTIDDLKDENLKLKNESEALKDRLTRNMAEYDNYRKRTAKEKEGIYTDACEDILKNILPVLDNLERAISVEGNVEDLKKGVEMTMKQFSSALEKLNVEEINTDDGFDPNFHNAVMHIDDDSYDKNQVVEVFQKGYKRGEKVLRYSMVKVAN
ncbi:nucleotide exchange factor GrpE [Clostridium fermenticellae]|uniref:Protein GrpE n=1 Tax=Clostridium fermenticellae TaxID=2068654 RepID=A0A386H5Z4_9CLOT|nr:nucleotide exchange factor GrpE [Clostridium fermenticellae]AYD40988.1 nucleotide exchange factor GrpE [Clostridium fermenticellae]